MSPPPEADRVLDLASRRRIYECVRDHPGLHLRALAERLGIPVSTLEYHTHQLQRHGQVVTREAGGFKAFYPGDGMDRRDRDILYVVRHEVPRRVCAHLLLHPGSTPGAMKGAVGLSGPTLSFHLKRLRASGLVREEPAGRTKRLFVAEPERVASLLVSYRASFLDDAVDRFAEAWLALNPPAREARPEAGDEPAVGRPPET